MCVRGPVQSSSVVCLLADQYRPANSTSASSGMRSSDVLSATGTMSKPLFCAVPAMSILAAMQPATLVSQVSSGAPISVTPKLPVHCPRGASGPVLTGSASVNAPNAGLAPRGQWTGSFGVTEIGAPLLTCDTKVAGCIAARIDIAGTAQNNGFDMVPLAESTSELLIPEDAEVEFAGLYWSANKHTTDELWTGPLTHIELRGPRGVAQTIDDGQKIAEVADNAGRQYYQSYADVTELVQAGGSGFWSAEGAAVAATRKDPDRSYYAGWSLVVVYTTPGELEQNVTVYDGGAWVAKDSSVTFAFGADGQRDGRIGVVAWEGDRGNMGDTLGLNGVNLPPIRWDGALGSANDAFTAAALGR